MKASAFIAVAAGVGMFQVQGVANDAAEQMQVLGARQNFTDQVQLVTERQKAKRIADETTAMLADPKLREQAELVAERMEAMQAASSFQKQAGSIADHAMAMMTDLDLQEQAMRVAKQMKVLEAKPSLQDCEELQEPTKLVVEGLKALKANPVFQERLRRLNQQVEVLLADPSLQRQVSLAAEQVRETLADLKPLHGAVHAQSAADQFSDSLATVLADNLIDRAQEQLRLHERVASKRAPVQWSVDEVVDTLFDRAHKASLAHTEALDSATLAKQDAEAKGKASREPKRALLSEAENLAVGSVGGTVETVINMPVLTTKFCLQEGRKLPSTLSGFYRGTLVQAGNVAPITALQMFANGLAEKFMFGASETKPLTDGEKITCSCLAGAASGLLYSPVDLTMIQQQKLGKGVGETISHVIRNHGGLSLFRGLVGCVGREALYTVGYLGLAPVLADKFAAMAGRKENSFLDTLGGAIVAGTLAALMTHPMDTASTKLKADIAGLTYKSTLGAFPKIFAEEGIAGFYRGGAMRTLRLSIAFSVVAAMREAAILYKTNHGTLIPKFGA